MGTERRPALREPCAGCARSTSAGTSLFSDRRSFAGESGLQSHLCADCQASLARRRGGQRLSDEEVRRAVENGSAVGLLWGGGGIGLG